MDKNLCVEFFVPVQGGQGRFGTGYPVAKDLILTAQHVLFPTNRDDKKPIEMRWHNLAKPHNRWQAAGKIVWSGGRRFDAALIQHPLPKGIHHYGLLAEQRPATSCEWESEGFPEAGRKGDGSCPVGMMGKVFSSADRYSVIVLGADYPPGVAENWRGASGSPVFVGGRIVGVIKTCLGKFDARRLQATLSCKLLENKKFRAWVKYDDPTERVKALHEHVVQSLDSNQAVQHALRDRLPSEVLQSSADGTAGLASALFKLQLEPLLKILYDTKNMNQSAAVITTLRAITGAILPVFAEHADVKLVRENWDNVNMSVIELPAALETVAELIMAAVEKRPAVLRTPRTDNEFPVGEHCIETPPEGGRKHKDNFLDYWDQHIGKSVLSTDIRKRFPVANWSGVANEQLRTLAGINKKKYIILTFNHDTRDDEIRATLQQFKEIKRRYPALVILYLQNDPNRVIDETKDFGLLPHILK